MAEMLGNLMPDPLDIREITFSNLLLLGFEPDVYESRYKCPFNRDMFAFPNKKAMESVFYFLFTKLNPDVAKDEFRNCWPVHDKKQESAFRKITAAWLNRISKESHDSHLPRIVASVLMSPGGDKFYNLLFCFSSFVLREDLRKLLSKNDILLPWPSSTPATKSLLSTISVVLRAKTVSEKTRFLNIVKTCSSTQDQWVSYASELTKENRTIRKAKRDLEKSLKDLEAEHLQRGLLSPAVNWRQNQGSPYAGEVKSLKRTKVIQRVRECWKRIKEMYESQKLMRSRIDEMITGCPNKHYLRGSDIGIKVPDLLIRECDEEIYQKRIGNTYNNGRVNILSLVQLWNLSLHLMLEQFKTYPLPSVTKDEEEIRAAVHDQSSYLQTIQSLRGILEHEMIPELKDSIEELKEIIDLQQMKRKQAPSAAIKNFDFNLTGLPATPSINLNASFAQDDEPFSFTESILQKDNLATPKIVEQLLESLREVSLTHLEEAVMPEEKPAKQEPASTKPSYIARPKIPVPKAKLAAKTAHRSKANASHKDTLRKPIDETPKLPVSSFRKPGSRNVNDEASLKTRQTLQMGSDVSRPEEKAHNILAEKIVDSVLTQNPSNQSSSSSSRSVTPIDHGLEDPISAMAQDAFHSKDKIPRTPLVKLTREVQPERSSTDALRSYLAVSSIKEFTSPGEHLRVFSDSLNETPVQFKSPRKQHEIDTRDPFSPGPASGSVFTPGTDLKISSLERHQNGGFSQKEPIAEDWERLKNNLFYETGDLDLEVNSPKTPVSTNLIAELHTSSNHSELIIDMSADRHGGFVTPGNTVHDEVLSCEGDTPRNTNSKEVFSRAADREGTFETPSAVASKVEHDDPLQGFSQASVDSPGPKVTETSASKDDLKDIINRYKMIKQRTRNLANDNYDSTFSAEKEPRFDGLRSSTMPDTIATPAVTDNYSNNDTGVSINQVETLINDPGSSAIVDRLLNVSADSLGENHQRSEKSSLWNASFSQDVDIPVATQLSFVQRDTRDESHDFTKDLMLQFATPDQGENLTPKRLSPNRGGNNCNDASLLEELGQGFLSQTSGPSAVAKIAGTSIKSHTYDKPLMATAETTRHSESVYWNKMLDTFSDLFTNRTTREQSVATADKSDATGMNFSFESPTNLVNANERRPFKTPKTKMLDEEDFNLMTPGVSLRQGFQMFNESISSSPDLF